MRRIAALLILLVFRCTDYADSVVVFNEVMYHPANNNLSLQWVELYDQNSVDVDLSGWHLTGSINYTFPDGTIIRATNYLVVAGSPAAILAQSGQTNVVGPFTGVLSTAGDTLTLMDNNQRQMDSVSYGVGGAWPIGPNGSGASLVKKNPNASGQPAANWTSSTQMGGSPGTINFSGAPLTGASGDVVPLGAVWRYEDTGTDLGTGWRTPGFDDSSWASGAALFYSGMMSLPAPEVTPLASGRSTYYFRTTFNFAGDPSLELLSLRPVVDDGAIFYLNGAEVARFNMPAGPVNYSTMAASSIGNAGFSGPLAIAASNLVAGQNVLAVEVHQSSLVTNAGLRVISAGAYVVRWDGKDGDFSTPVSPALAPTNDALASLGVDVFTSSNTNLAAKLNDGRYGSGSSWTPATNDASPYVVLRFNQTIPISSIAWGRDNGDTNEVACGGTCTDHSLGNYTFQYTLVTNPPAVLSSSSDPTVGWTTLATVQYLSAQPGFTPSLRHRFDFVATNGNPILATGIRLRMAVTNTVDEIEINPPALPAFDAAFGAEMIMTDVLPPPPQLAFNEVSAASSTAFWLEIINNGATPVDLGGVSVCRPGAALLSYTFPSQILPPGGIVSLTEPQLRFGAANGDLLFLYGPGRFSLLDAVSVNTGDRGRHPDGTGDWFQPTVATPGYSNVVVLHEEIVFNELMYHYRPIDPAPPVTTNTTLLPITGGWRFNDTGTDLGTTWRATGYNDSAWPSGPALFYVNPGALPAATNTTLAAGRNTYYFRAAFNFSGATSNVVLNLRTIVDDGAVFYLNGLEVYRLNMATGPVTYSTSALAAVGNAGYTGPVVLSGTNLLQGVNVLAVEVHQVTLPTNQTGITLSGGGLALVEEGPVGNPAPMNLARQPGAAPFVIDSLAGYPIHDYLHLTDGTYGNPNSWIGNTGNPGFAGVRFGGLNTISGLAFGRDNLGLNTDRTLGLYTLQYTRVATPDVTTTVTSNADTGWQTIGTLNYQSAGSGLFAYPSRRHRYSFTPVQATGLRLVVPGTGLSSGTCIDELEVNPPDTVGDIAFGAELVLTTTLAPATPFTKSAEQWVEFFNRSSNLVSLTGWRIDSGIHYKFPAGSSLAPGAYLVVAKDSAALRAKWPEVAPLILGDFSGKISSGDSLVLKDALDNPVNTIDVLASGWSDGGGSSLELTDPRADNRNPEAWADSDESGRSVWQTVTYRMICGQNFGNTLWNEFRLGILDAGEVLIDDVSVIRDPDGANQELIQNGNFESSTGSTHWRWLGDHDNSRIIPDPDNPGNHVLKVCGTAPPRTSHNHIESSFVANTPLVDGQLYQVSYRARWLAGSPQVGTSAYMQRLARATILTLPARHGTPGAPNSRRVNNSGPTFTALQHTPMIPATNQPVTISVRASDADGVASVTLNYRLNPATTFNSLPMILQADGRWTASIPGQVAGQVVQFYVTAQDTLGAIGQEPPNGPASRALYQVADGQGSNLPAHELRLIQLDADRDFVLNATNVMSQGFVGGTLIYDRSEVFYDVGVRLHGSAAGRARDGDAYISYTVAFPPNHLFRGVQGEVNLDRSGRTPVVRQQDEIYILHMFHRAGITCHFADLCYFITPKTLHTGTAILQLAAYGGVFVQDQFNTTGSIFNFDLTYEPSVTVDGTSEGIKLPVPLQGQLATDFTDLGNDKEQYRAPYDMRHGTRMDDFSGIIRLCQTTPLPQAQFDAQIGAALDVDEMSQITALTILCGIGDIYYSPMPSNPHNLRIFTPLDGGPAHFLPWDMDFVFNNSTTSPIYLDSSFTLSKLFNNIAVKRAYLGHVNDLCQSVFNTTYLTPWLAHYGSVVGQNYSGGATYIQSRHAFALSQLPAVVPFAITSNSGKDFMTNTPTLILNGSGWLDINQIVLNNASNPPVISWRTITNWQVTVPLLLGTNYLSFSAYGRSTNLLGTRNITVTSTATTGAPDSDGDGMPDAWELAHGLNPNLNDASLDSDGDGLTNLQEYLAGTDPRDPQSFLRLSATNDAANVRLRFTAVAGRSYSVLYRSDPGSGAWSKQADVPPRAGDNAVELVVPQPVPGPQRFYRLVTPQVP